MYSDAPKYVGHKQFNYVGHLLNIVIPVYKHSCIGMYKNIYDFRVCFIKKTARLTCVFADFGEQERLLELLCLLNLTVLLKIRKHTETTPLTCTRTYFLFDVTARLSQHISTTDNPDVIFRCGQQVVYI